MKSKTLITMAVASTFGWSAASFAGSSHEVVTPFSPNESGEVIFQYKQGFSSTDDRIMTGSVSDYGSGTISGSYDVQSSASSTMSDPSASASMDESFAAADQGLYSDFYVVSLAPATESWDYYIIDNGGTPELVALSDTWMPTHELALVPSESDEMVYELALVPTFDHTILLIDDMSGEATGE
jgi:hypothetical protein